jgi:DNA replication and repair protein RecF
LSLSEVKLSGFRNLTETDVKFHENWNVITGDNATGKTSLLEALYYLGRGRSFRAKNPSEMIQQQQNELVVSGAVSIYQESVRIGIKRDKQSTLVRINGETTSSAAQLARYIPILFIGPESHKLITEGPAVRRKFMDWGVFHLNENFLPIWQRYQTALKQRNALLRNNNQTLPASLNSWHITLQDTADQIDVMREEFIMMLEEAFSKVLQILLPEIEIALSYKKGWGDNELATILDNEWQSDCSYGHTRSGPHRADIQMKVNGKPAAERLSKGQLKLTSIALLISQSYVFGETAVSQLLLLVDDLPAELDAQNRDIVLNLFAQLDAQLFITATDIDLLPMLKKQQHSHFKLEQGNISQT